MKRKICLTAIVMLILCIFPTGCNSDVDFPGNDEGKKVELVNSFEISIPMEKIRTLNPVLSNDEDAYYINRLIYQGLFEQNKNLEVFSTLVENYEYLDGVTLVLYLLEGVTWQDGEAFAGKDVKFSIDAYKSVASDKQGVYANYISSIRSTKVLDPYTVEIKFMDENNACLENLTFPILPSHKYKRPADLARAENNFKPLGTGPYMIDRFEEGGGQIVLSGNPNYLGGSPGNVLIFNMMPKKEDALNLFDMGEASLTYLRNIDRDTLIENKTINIIPFISNEVEILAFNFNHGALQNSDVRYALAHAIDSQSVLETCYFNSGVINGSIYFPNYLGDENTGDPYTYDVNVAKSLLSAAGFEGLSLNLVFNGDNLSRNLSAQLIKSNLEKIGVSVNLRSLNEDDYIVSLEKGDFDIYLGGFKINERYDLRPMLHTKGQLNYINYSNPKIDLLLDKMMQGISREKKERTYKTIKSLYKDELPYYCLLYKTYGFAASESLDGDINPYFNNIYNGCESWKLTYERLVE